VTPGSQADASVPREPSPTPAAQESDPQVAVAAPGQSVSRASKVPKVRTVPKLAARRTSAVPSGVEIRETSPQARLIMARSGYVPWNVFVLAPHSYVPTVTFLSSSASEAMA
jgi:hypothetical protein